MPQTSASSGTAQSVVVLKLSSSGAPVWARTFGEGYGFEVALSPDGEAVYVTGYQSAAATLGAHSVDGSLGGFALKLAAADGAPLWLVDVPGCRGIRADADGAHVMLMGSPFSGTTSVAGSTLRSRGSTDTFVAKLSAADGSGVWGIDAGGDGMDYPWGFDVDRSGNTFVAGLTASSTITFGAMTRANAMHSSAKTCRYRKRLPLNRGAPF